MNKKLKMVGKGFVYGLRHPFTDEGIERTADMTVIDKLLGDAGTCLSQGAFRAIYGSVSAILFLMALGYLNEKINKSDIGVKMIIEENQEKK